MKEKKGHVSFDAMVKYFIKKYEIPTRRDVDRITGAIDRLEKRITALSATKRQTRQRRVKADKKSASGEKQVLTATDIVYDTIKAYGQGVRFKEIQAQTDFDEKKIRNIIFRLTKLQKITRISRGLYKAI